MARYVNFDELSFSAYKFEKSVNFNGERLLSNSPDF